MGFRVNAIADVVGVTMMKMAIRKAFRMRTETKGNWKPGVADVDETGEPSSATPGCVVVILKEEFSLIDPR